MAVETTTTYPHIEKMEGRPARLRDTPRVRVKDLVAEYLRWRWTVNQLCLQHPFLTPAEGHAAMAYYYDHKEEIDAEIKADDEEYERARAAAPPSPFVDRMKAQGLL